MDFKSMPTNKKIEYIWDYYKLHIIAVIMILLMVGYFIYENKTKVDYVFNITMLNAVIEDEGVKKISKDVTTVVVEDGDKKKEALLSYIPNDILNEKKADPNYITQFMAKIQIGEIDLVIVDKSELNKLIQLSALINLNTIGINNLNIAKDKLVELSQDGEKGIYAVDISNSKYFKNIGIDTNNRVIAGITSSKNQDKIRDVLNILIN